MRLIDFVAGSSVGFIQTVFGQPLDYLKVKYQTTQINQKKTFFDFNKQILSKNNIFGYYRGSAGLLSGLPFVTGLYFALNEALKRRLIKLQKIQSTRPPQQVLKLRLIGLAGIGTGLISSFLICPLQYAKVKRQTSDRHYIKGSISLIFNAIRRGQKHKLFSGLTSTFQRQGIGGFFYFTAYQEATRFICRRRMIKRQYAGFWEYFIAGGVAGFTYWTIIYPWDHIKTRVQCRMAGQLEKISSLKSTYRGYHIAIIRGTAINALGLSLFQLIKNSLQILDLAIKA